MMINHYMYQNMDALLLSHFINIYTCAPSGPILAAFAFLLTASSITPLFLPPSIYQNELVRNTDE